MATLAQGPNKRRGNSSPDPRHAARDPSGILATQLARNQTRDRFVTRTLRRVGWRLLRIWGHELTKKNTRRLGARFRRAGLVT